MKKIKTSHLAPLFILIIFGYVVVANILSYHHFFRVDLTEKKVYSISELSKEQLRSMGNDVSIELYISQNLPPDAEKIRLYIADIITEFKAVAGKKLTVVWKDPSRDQEAMNEAHTLGIRPQPFQTIVKDKQEIAQVYLGIVIRQYDKVEVLPTVKTLPTLEYDLIHRIMALSGEQTRVGFLKTDTFPSVDPSWLGDEREKLPSYLTLRKYRLMYDVLDNEFDLSYIDINQAGKIDPSIFSPPFTRKTST